MKNGNKIQKKSEKTQGWIGDDAGRALISGSNYCWVMHSGSKVGPKKEIWVLFDLKVRKKKIMMIIPIRV